MWVSVEAWLTAHTASTLFMTGLIWFVQLVHYPLFGAVGTTAFSSYEAQHTARTGLVVGPPMLLELAAAIALVAVVPDRASVLAWIGLAILVGVWAVTAGWSVPAHRRLSAGFDTVAHRALVRSNWARTAGWSARAVIALWLPRLLG